MGIENIRSVWGLAVDFAFVASTFPVRQPTVVATAQVAKLLGASWAGHVITACGSGNHRAARRTRLHVFVFGKLPERDGIRSGAAGFGLFAGFAFVPRLSALDAVGLVAPSAGDVVAAWSNRNGSRAVWCQAHHCLVILRRELLHKFAVHHIELVFGYELFDLSLEYLGRTLIKAKWAGDATLPIDDGESTFCDDSLTVLLQT